MMTRKIREGPVNSTDKPVVLWKYTFHCQTNNVDVCQKFLCNLLNIGKSRFETIRNKLLNNITLNDNRGKHENQVVKLTDELKKLIQQHCESIPHSESHYDREDTTLQYFDHPDLTLTKIYKMFLEYYSAATGDLNAPFDESTYSKYFNHYVPFSFSRPRIDVCDFCFLNENKPDERDNFELHIKNFNLHKHLKHSMLSEKKCFTL